MFSSSGTIEKGTHVVQYIHDDTGKAGLQYQTQADDNTTVTDTVTVTVTVTAILFLLVHLPINYTHYCFRLLLTRQIIAIPG